MDYIVVFITAADRAEAEKIGNRLVAEKLVACANIGADIHSIYWWRGKIESSSEVPVMFKTRTSLFDKVAARIRELHSYEVPEIIALPIIHGYKDYLDWIDASTAVGREPET